MRTMCRVPPEFPGLLVEPWIGACRTIEQVDMRLIRAYCVDTSIAKKPSVLAPRECSLRQLRFVVRRVSEGMTLL